MGGLFSYFMGDPGPIPTVNPADEDRYTLPLGPVTDSSVPTTSPLNHSTAAIHMFVLLARCRVAY
jgi:hypothetical protein